MSKISLPVVREAEEAANLYVSPDSDRKSKNTIVVSTVRWIHAGARSACAEWNTPAVSFKIDCADQAEVDRLWYALLANGGKAEQCGWLKDRYGVSWQIVPTALVKYLGGADAAGAQRAMQAMMGMVKLDIEGLKRAYEGKSAA
jgi:predicted 3-demethylubiquinone-9 3-methyltransferase (glyoxalase superfamily)